MKLLRLKTRDALVPCVLRPDGTFADVSTLVVDFGPGFFSRGGIQVLHEEMDWILTEAPVLREHESLAPPIGRPGKIVCIGRNYRDHAIETGVEIPEEPVVFLKALYTVAGPNGVVRIPRDSVKTDWEIELGVVIGARASYLSDDDDPSSFIAGFTISHDVSEREFQLKRGGTWDKGKSCDTFNPLGPYLLTPDDLQDPQSLRMELWVNGLRRQAGSTANMIFSVNEVIRYVSKFMVLEPGDLINTGTPAGVALGRPDVAFLRAGDVVELEIAGLGRQMQRFENAY